MKLSEELQTRGFIKQVSNESLSLIFDEGKRVVYHGIDPSADSAHAGNFVVWMMLKHLVNAGHEVVFLIGGGTGMIGDPKPDAERVLSTRENVDLNVSKIKQQAKDFFGSDRISFVDNYEWLGSLELIPFLRDIGKHFTINELIKKDAISRRLASENGLSYTEFAYPLLQAYDYLKLYRDKNVTLQVGGSDQWGNIISGVDLVRRVDQGTVFAVTVPLVVDKVTGKKFGKSEGNAVWLASEKTTAYDFYQFWLNVDDENVIDYLKLFTLLPLVDIADLEQDLKVNSGSRLAQKTLAKAVTALVHTEKEAEAVSKVSDFLFGSGDLADLNNEELEILLKTAPVTEVALGSFVIDVLVDSGLATSKREARGFVASDSIILNNHKIKDVERVIEEGDFKNKVTLLRRGKKKYCVLKIADL